MSMTEQQAKEACLNHIEEAVLCITGFSKTDPKTGLRSWSHTEDGSIFWKNMIDKLEDVFLEVWARLDENTQYF